MARTSPAPRDASVRRHVQRSTLTDSAGQSFNLLVDERVPAGSALVVSGETIVVLKNLGEEG